MKIWIALVVARATIHNRTHGKTTLFPLCEGSASREMGHDFPANPLRAGSAEQGHEQHAQNKPQQAVMAQGFRRFFGEFLHDAPHHVGEERPESAFKRKAEAKGAQDELRGGSHVGMMTGTGAFVKDENRLRRQIPGFPACRPRPAAAVRTMADDKKG